MTEIDLGDIFRKNILSITPYVPGKPIDEVKRELGLTDVIKMASNENPLGASPRAIEAIKNAASKCHLYPDGSCYKLKNTLSEFLGLSAEQLIIGNGSDEIIKMIGETFIKEGEEVIFASPSFVEYEFVSKVMAASYREIKLKNHTHDLASMKEAITDKTRLVFICNPNNPTGTIVTGSEVNDFMEGIPDGVIVVFDEAYYEYVSNEKYPQTIEYVRNNKNVIILRTFSKAYGLAGLRVGYGIAKPGLINLISRVREPFNVNSLAQEAALVSLYHEEYLTKCIRHNLKEKEYLYEEFEQMGLEYIPSQTNFIMVNTGINSKNCFNDLLKQGIIVRTGDIFGMSQWIRVTIGTVDENRRFIRALKEILGR